MKKLITTTMKYILFSILFLLTACTKKPDLNGNFSKADSLALLEMVQDREKGMTEKNISTVVNQFAKNPTFINGGGYYYNGIAEIKKFHLDMFTKDSVKYDYKIGKTLIHPIHENLALVYYPWQQDWMMKDIESDTLHEIGLMTIVAIKQDGTWKWKSITNQRTKEFFMDLKNHKFSK